MEVDLEYPEELHDKHDEKPLAPENGVNKFVPRLGKREKYVFDLLLQTRLIMYEYIGIKVKKYHRAVKFTPERWMKPYIEKKNTQLKQ